MALCGGAGGVLLINDEPKEYFKVVWTPQLAKKLKVKIGDPAAQTVWEYAAALLTLIAWGSAHRVQGLHVQGDNIPALQGAVTLTGRNKLTAITKELSWRRVRYGWKYDAGHLPSEANTVADALSRLAAPAGSDRKQFPTQLSEAAEVSLDPDSLLTLL